MTPQPSPESMPTLDKQIAFMESWLGDLDAIRIKQPTPEAILTSLRTLKRIQSATMPEPVAWFNPTTGEFIKDEGDEGFKDFIPLYGPEVLAIIAGLRAERDNWRNAAEAIRLNHKAYSERAAIAESRLAKVMEHQYRQAMKPLIKPTMTYAEWKAALLRSAETPS